MGDHNAAYTHTAFAVQRTGRKLEHWLEVGNGRVDEEGVHVFLDRLPVGGFTGYIRLLPNGTTPSTQEAIPERPSQGEDSGV